MNASRSLLLGAVTLFLTACSSGGSVGSLAPTGPTGESLPQVRGLALDFPATVPRITDVTRIRPKQTQTITITGTGFGHSQPYNGDGNGYLVFYDLTGGWAAGCTLQLEGGDCLVTVNVTRWTNTKITVAGLTGDYGSSGWILNPGDRIKVAVYNAQTVEGPATKIVRVQ